MVNTETPTRLTSGALAFAIALEANRRFNREFYHRVPPELLDVRVVDPLTRRADSVRDSWLYLMYVTRNYAYSVRHGLMQWGPARESTLMAPALEVYDKPRLLIEWERVERELRRELRDPEIESRLVSVSWSEEALPALEVLQGLLDQEMLAASWNRSLMRHLGMAPIELRAAG